MCFDKLGSWNLKSFLVRVFVLREFAAQLHKLAAPSRYYHKHSQRERREMIVKVVFTKFSLSRHGARKITWNVSSRFKHYNIAITGGGLVGNAMACAIGIFSWTIG